MKPLTDEQRYVIQAFWNGTWPYDENVPYTALKNRGMNDVNTLIESESYYKQRAEELEQELKGIGVEQYYAAQSRIVELERENEWFKSWTDSLKEQYEFKVKQLEQKLNQAKTDHKRLKEKYRVLDFNKLQGRFYQKCNEIEQLEQQLKQAVEVLEEIVDYSDWSKVMHVKPKARSFLQQMKERDTCGS